MHLPNPSLDPPLKVATAAREELHKPHWYLTEEIAVFSLCSVNFFNIKQRKYDMEDRFYSTRIVDEFPREILVMLKTISFPSNLVDLTGPDSKFIFRVLSQKSNRLRQFIDL